MLKRTLWAAAVVLVANLTALLVVAADRRGQPDSVLTLTERELRVAASGTDATGMTLALQWNRETSRAWVGNSAAALPWFDRAKLASIGFDCTVEPNATGALEHYSGPAVTPRTTYLVFEYDASSDGALDAPPAPPAAPQPESSGGAARQADPAFRSRLRPIDAGNDPLSLRAKYRDRHRYLVTAGSVRLRIVRASALQPARLDGLILEVLPSELYVPRGLQATIAASLGQDGDDGYGGLSHPPRYEVTVEYGRDLLPRIVGARALPRTPAAR